MHPPKVLLGTSTYITQLAVAFCTAIVTRHSYAAERDGGLADPAALATIPVGTEPDTTWQRDPLDETVSKPAELMGVKGMVFLQRCNARAHGLRFVAGYTSVVVPTILMPSKSVPLGQTADPLASATRAYHSLVNAFMVAGWGGFTFALGESLPEAVLFLGASQRIFSVTCDPRGSVVPDTCYFTVIATNAPCKSP